MPYSLTGSRGRLTRKALGCRANAEATCSVVGGVGPCIVFILLKVGVLYKWVVSKLGSLEKVAFLDGSMVSDGEKDVSIVGSEAHNSRTAGRRKIG